MLSLTDVCRLPKAHLHIHLEGSVRGSLVRYWSELAGVAEPAFERWDSLPTFLGELDKVKGLIPDADALSEAARCFMHDEASDGVVWTEPQMNPLVMADRVDAATLVDAVLDGLRAGSNETGIGFGLILAINRTRPLGEAMDVAHLAVERAGRGVVGLGLSNDENASLATDYADAFSLTESAGLLRVPHAGESAGAESVKNALQLDPHRIMHGVRAIEDPLLLEHLAIRQIELDTTPSCNVELGVFDSLNAFPARTLLDAGIPYSVGADCLLMMRTTASLELLRIAHAHRLDRSEVAGLAEASIHASTAPADTKRAAIARIGDWRDG